MKDRSTVDELIDILGATYFIRISGKNGRGWEVHLSQSHVENPFYLIKKPTLLEALEGAEMDNMT